MTPRHMANLALDALLAGTRMTMTIPVGMRFPSRFPRGTLMSITGHGQNYSFDPLKILAYIQRNVRRDVTGCK